MKKLITYTLVVLLTLSQASFVFAEDPAAQPDTNSQLANPAKPAYCPDTPPSAGPSEGQDYQEEFARAFNQVIANSGFRDEGLVGAQPDKKSENLVVEIAKKYAPGPDGKTRFKYSVDGDGPNSFDCSGFVHSVLKQAKAKGANVQLGSQSFTGSYTKVGRLIHQTTLTKNSKGGARLRTNIDLPGLNLLRPGDLIFFGTSTACSNDKNCPNEVGHIGIYLGNGKYIHSTSSDENLERDSASNANNYLEPPIKAHPEGSQYKSYNGVKVSNFEKSYFTPGFYIMVRRVIPETITDGIYGAVDGLGATTFPGGKNAYVSFNSCHGSSMCHPGEKHHHGVYRNRPQGDAIDITPKDGYGIAAFSGTATAGGSGRNSYTVLTSQNGRVKAYYYHTSNVKQGKVQVGERIVRTGVSGIHHIHFELLVDGKSTHGILVYRSGEREYVKSLWKNMKQVLGLL